MLALVFASAVTVVLLGARIIWTHNLRYSFLVWNLFLAWVPMIFSVLACERFRTQERCDWRFFGLAGAWLLFFPNAPYIFTDVIHLATHFFNHFWIDLTLVLLCALTGFVLGFVSLYLMQSLVTRLFGRIAGWLFVGAVAGLCSLGICLGRFFRMNSWDLLVPAHPAVPFHWRSRLESDERPLIGRFLDPVCDVFLPRLLDALRAHALVPRPHRADSSATSGGINVARRLLAAEPAGGC